MWTVTWIALSAGASGLMAAHLSRRTRRNGWRFFIGLSMLGLVILASASHANAATSGGALTAQSRQSSQFFSISF